MRRVLRRLVGAGSFRRQIVLTFVIGFFLLSSMFVAYMVKADSESLYRSSSEDAHGMAESLAVSALPWVLSNDVVGLQEVVQALRGRSHLRYAMVITPAGRVMAHTDAEKIGQYVSDERSLAMLRAPAVSQALVDSAALIDIAVPIMLTDQQVGWARVALERDWVVANLRWKIASSVMFVLLASAMALLAAILIVKRLGNRVASLVRVAEAVRAGDFSMRVDVGGARDETTALGNSFNQMLDALAHNEKALRTVSLYTRSLIEASLDPLVTISAEGKITDVNASTEQVTGRSRAELVGTDFSDYFTEPGKARAGYRLAFDQGLVRDYPLEIRHRDGRRTPVLYNATLYRDVEGRVAGVFAAARDVTEKKKSEDALRANERFLDSVVEHIPNMLFVKDAETLRFVRFNKAGERLLGYTRDELIGKNDYDLFPREQADAFVSMDREIIRRGEMVDIAEEPIDTRSRGRRYLHTRKIPIFADDGAPLYLLGISEDVTERKLAEQQLNRIREGLAEAQRIAHLGNWELDLERNALTWSDEIYRIFEIDPQKFGASYEAFLNAIHPDDRDMVNKAYTESVMSKTPYDIVHRLLMKDGRVKYVNEKCETYYGEDGRPLRSVGTVHDITDIKKAEARINELNRDLEKRVTERTAQLEAANKELEAFSYSVSHDLRAPLRAIDGFSHILLEDYAGKLDDEGRRLLNVVRNNAARMGQLIDDILKFSRAGRLGMTYAEVDMAALAREAWEELQPSAPPAARVEIANLPRVPGDRAMLRQVLVNLLSNAIKFSRDRETPRVEVGGAIEGDEAIYFVRDNGVGFDMQYADKLFGVFQRLHSMEEFEGTGIGLAIVKRVIGRHGGSVRAEGRLNEGATIYFILPVKEKAHG